MADAIISLEASKGIFCLYTEFKSETVTVTKPTTNVAVNSRVGDVSCERNIEDITTYSQTVKYCGSDLVGDLGLLLTAFGGTFEYSDPQGYPGVITVAGAGEPGYDGDYEYAALYSTATKLAYGKDNNNKLVGYDIFSGGWEILDNSGFPISMYTNPSADYLPPETGWVVASGGSSPAPTISYDGFGDVCLTGLTINMNAGDYCSVEVAYHNHEINPHILGDTSWADVSDFLPHEVGEAFEGWDGFGVPDFGITNGADSSPASATATFSMNHVEQIDEQGNHLVGTNITPRCELSMEFGGIPTSNTIALLNADYAANTNAMLGAITDSVDFNDSNSDFDSFSLVAHANADINLPPHSTFICPP